MQRPWRNTVYRLAPLGLHSLLSYTIQDQPSRGDITHSRLAIPHLSLIKTMTYRHVHRPIYGDSVSTEFPLSRDSRTLICFKLTKLATTAPDEEEYCCRQAHNLPLVILFELS